MEILLVVAPCQRELPNWHCAMAVLAVGDALAIKSPHMLAFMHPPIFPFMPDSTNVGGNFLLAKSYQRCFLVIANLVGTSMPFLLAGLAAKC